jgi:hypothetical protein
MLAGQSGDRKRKREGGQNGDSQCKREGAERTAIANAKAASTPTSSRARERASWRSRVKSKAGRAGDADVKRAAGESVGYLELL